MQVLHASISGLQPHEIRPLVIRDHPPDPHSSIIARTSQHPQPLAILPQTPRYGIHIAHSMCIPHACDRCYPSSGFLVAI